MANSVSRSRSMASPELPGEIIAEILEKLPVKSLLRLKIVSKMWLTLISNTRFIQSHLRRALIPTLLTIEWELDPDIYALRNSIARQQDQPDPRITERVRHLSDSDSPVCFQRIVKPKIFSDFSVVASCNGIICLTSSLDTTSSIYLWNPLLKHYKKLPVPDPGHVRVLGLGTWSFSMIAFGYDSISNDCKVLKFVSKKQIYKSNDPIVQLYSANADSWTELTDPILTKWNHVSQLHTVVNGVLYFHDGVYFNLHEQVFGLVPFPLFARDKMSNFLDFQGSVAMVLKCSGEKQEVTLCTLDTVSRTWTKKFRLKADLRLNFYIGYGQFYGDLCSGPGNRCHIMYDYEKEQAYHCKHQVSQDNFHRAFKYTESLVSFKGYEEVV